LSSKRQKCVNELSKLFSDLKYDKIGMFELEHMLMNLE